MNFRGRGYFDRRNGEFSIGVDINRLAWFFDPENACSQCKGVVGTKVAFLNVLTPLV
jgi:hypothetical protein